MESLRFEMKRITVVLFGIFFSANTSNEKTKPKILSYIPACSSSPQLLEFVKKTQSFSKHQGSTEPELIVMTGICISGLCQKDNTS